MYVEWGLNFFKKTFKVIIVGNDALHHVTHKTQDFFPCCTVMIITPLIKSNRK